MKTILREEDSPCGENLEKTPTTDKHKHKHEDVSSTSWEPFINSFNSLLEMPLEGEQSLLSITQERLLIDLDGSWWRRLTVGPARRHESRRKDGHTIRDTVWYPIGHPI